jgi:hypothetical protein
MARISSTFSGISKRPKIAAKVPASSEDSSDRLVSAAAAKYEKYEEKSVANMIRAVVGVVKDEPILAPQSQLYTGSREFHVPLLSGTVLDLYKHVMKAHKTPVTDPIEEEAFFLEYYTNIRLLNGKFTPMTVKLIGMEPFAYSPMEFDVKDQPDEYMIDFFHNILRLGLATEEDIEYFLNMPPYTQNNVEGYLLDETKVRTLLASGQHIVFTEEAVAATVVLLDSVNSFVLKLFPLA